MKFNINLKEIRKESGLTQKNIYEILKVSANCYASWEQGRTEPNIDNIIKLCKILNVSADYLLGLEDESGRILKTQFDTTIEEFTYSDGIHNINHKRKNN